MKPYSNGELAQMEQAGKNAEHCVCCGDIIPEGRQVCPMCEKRQFPPDYIDRRKLKSEMMELIPTRLFNEEDMLDLVNEQPRADVVERKKGFWEYVDDVDYRCSVCHKYAFGCLGEVISGQYKYCPYCGTAMGGEGDDAKIH